MQYLTPFLSALSLTVLGSFAILHLFPKLGLMDRPHLYGLKRKPIPYPAGVIIWLVFAVCVLYFAEMRDSVIGLLLAGTLIMGVSFADDRLRLPPWLRFFVQIIAAGILIYFHVGITHVTLPWGEVADLTTWKIPLWQGHFTVWSDLLTLFLVILFTNSMNWLDGSPGLPSGISFIASGILFLLAMRPDLHAIDQTQFATLAIILAGACLGFVFFDFPKPKFLIGDTGSMFLGFTLGALAIISGGKLATTFLILGIPLVDALLVILNRILHGKKPWQGDTNHLHHRLMRAGLTQKQTAIVVYVWALVFGLAALFLHTNGKAIALIILAISIISLEFFVTYRRKN